MNNQVTPPTFPAPVDRLLRLPSVIEAVGFQRSAIYARIKNGTFPAPVKIGARASAWPASQIQTWIQGQIRAAGESK